MSCATKRPDVALVATDLVGPHFRAKIDWASYASNDSGKASAFGARAKKNKTARCTVFALADFIWPVYHDGTAQVADLGHATFGDEDVCGLPSGTVIVAQPVEVCAAQRAFFEARGRALALRSR